MSWLLACVLGLIFLGLMLVAAWGAMSFFVEVGDEQGDAGDGWASDGYFEMK